MPEQDPLCTDQQIASLVELISVDEAAGLRELDELLSTVRTDARLHFLKGSMLAAAGEFEQAIMTIRHAVDLAPDFDLARFQLGFLLLTSNEPYAAQEAWGPLHGLPRDTYLRMFVEGLCHLIRDEFEEAAISLNRGIELNMDNLPLNADMRLILAQMEAGQRDTISGAGDIDVSPMSATQMLLQQSALKSTRH